MSLSTQRLSLLLAAVISLIPFSIDAYLPALTTMAEELGSSLHQLEFTISSFILGYAAGSLLGGPLSDQFGRRRIAILGLIVYLIASLLIIFLQDYQTLLLLRFAQAIGGGAATIVVPAIVRDRYPRQESAKVMTTISFIMMAAPLVAPMVGAVILNVWGWRPIFLFLALYSGLIVLLVSRYFPSDPIQNPDQRGFTFSKTLHDHTRVISDIRTRPYLISHCMCRLIFLTYITQAAFVIQELMGFSVAQFPFVFGAFISCLLLANRYNAYLLKHHDTHTIFSRGLYCVLFSTTALFTTAVLCDQSSLWPLGCLMLVVSTLGLVTGNSQVGFLHYFPDQSGTASSILQTLALISGSAGGAIVSTLYNATLIPMASVMVVAALVSLLSGLQATPPEE